MMMMKAKSTKWILLVVSLLLEGLSATLDQLGFALLGMIMAFIGLFLSVVDLIFQAQQKRLMSSFLPCFRRNFSSKGERFDSLVAYFGVACAAWQCLYSTTGYVYAHQNLGNPIRMCLLPFVFVFCVVIIQFTISTVPSDEKSQATEAQTAEEAETEAQTAEEAETEVVRQSTPQLQHFFHSPPDGIRFNKKMEMIFSKELLSRTDIEHRLSVPMENHGAFPLGEDFVATDEKTGHKWTFHYSVRREGHPKPVLVKEWLAFVRRNNLQIGDGVEFHKFQDRVTGEIRYRVRARARGEKPVKIFGTIIG